MTFGSGLMQAIAHVGRADSGCRALAAAVRLLHHWGKAKLGKLGKLGKAGVTCVRDE